MKELHIGPNDAGQRLDKFLTKTYPSLPSSLLYKYLRLKRIKCNGKRCEISTRLQEGDVMELERSFNAYKVLSLLYRALSASK